MSLLINTKIGSVRAEDLFEQRCYNVINITVCILSPARYQNNRCSWDISISNIVITFSGYKMIPRFNHKAEWLHMNFRYQCFHYFTIMSSTILTSAFGFLQYQLHKRDILIYCIQYIHQRR